MPGDRGLLLLMWPGGTYGVKLSREAKRPGSPIERRILVSHTSCNDFFPRILFHGSLLWGRECFPVSVFIDSGADGNFVDSALVQQADIPIEPLASPLAVYALDGCQLSTLTHRTRSISLHLSGNHREVTQFMVISSPHAPIVLGRPWLQTHNSHIDWVTGAVKSWSAHRHSFCLQSALSPASSSRFNQCTLSIPQPFSGIF